MLSMETVSLSIGEEGKVIFFNFKDVQFFLCYGEVEPWGWMLSPSIFNFYLNDLLNAVNSL